mgnify:CR=1 FL=1
MVDARDTATGDTSEASTLHEHPECSSVMDAASSAIDAGSSPVEHAADQKAMRSPALARRPTSSLNVSQTPLVRKNDVLWVVTASTNRPTSSAASSSVRSRSQYSCRSASPSSRRRRRSLLDTMAYLRASLSPPVRRYTSSTSDAIAESSDPRIESEIELLDEVLEPPRVAEEVLALPRNLLASLRRVLGLLGHRLDPGVHV